MQTAILVDGLTLQWGFQVSQTNWKWFIISIHIHEYTLYKVNCKIIFLFYIYTMANQILVKTPLTLDGNAPVMENGRQVYSESILGISAKPVLEKRNTTLPPHLKVIIEDYSGPVGVKAPDEPEIVVPKTTVKTVSNAKA